MVCVSTRALVYILYAAGDLLHSIFRDRYVGWAVARGDVCAWGGGNGLSSNSVCIANGLISKAKLYKDTVIKNHKFSFSGTRVKYLDHEERACIVCMSKYMRFGLNAYLQKPLIIV